MWLINKTLYTFLWRTPYQFSCYLLYFFLKHFDCPGEWWRKFLFPSLFLTFLIFTLCLHYQSIPFLIYILKYVPSFSLRHLKQSLYLFVLTFTVEGTRIQEQNASIKFCVRSSMLTPPYGEVRVVHSIAVSLFPLFLPTSSWKASLHPAPLHTATDFLPEEPFRNWSRFWVTVWALLTSCLGLGFSPDLFPRASPIAT